MYLKETSFCDFDSKMNIHQGIIEAYVIGIFIVIKLEAGENVCVGTLIIHYSAQRWCVVDLDPWWKQ